MLRRFSPIWAGMGVLRAITLALYAAYQSCKTRGTHCQPLLELLLEMDAGRYLDVPARKNVEVEITNFAQVCDRRSLAGTFVDPSQGSTSIRWRSRTLSQETARDTLAFE
jgi:hypothetical protein